MEQAFSLPSAAGAATLAVIFSEAIGTRCQKVIPDHS